MITHYAQAFEGIIKCFSKSCVLFRKPVTDLRLASRMVWPGGGGPVCHSSEVRKWNVMVN